MLSSFLLVLTTISFCFSGPILVLTSPILGLDSFITQQLTLDPHATNDSFLTLPTLLKKTLNSHPPFSISLSVSVPIHIVLIGPNFNHSSIPLLYSFLSHSLSNSHSPFHSLSSISLSISHSLSFSTSLSSTSLTNSLSTSLYKLLSNTPSNLRSPITPISHFPFHSLSSFSISDSLSFSTSLSFTSLTNSLSTSLSKLLSKTPSNLRSPITPISHSPIDNIINNHYNSQKTNTNNEYYIYILNLGKKEKPYAYTYGTGSGELTPGSTECLGSIWAGKQRYLWVDLNAGPVDYGPAISGDGVLPKGDSHPLSALHGKPKAHKAVLADLASLVYSAYQVLLVPPLRISVPFENSLTVQFIHIRDSDVKDTKGLNFKLVEKTFMDEANDGGLLLRDQTLKFTNYDVEYKKCSICSFAVSRAITSYTSRYLFDNYTLIVSEYLDSKRLHQILLDSAEEIRRVAKIPEEDFGRVIPVYVFDLDINNILLLDRYHQTVAFNDMVVAVRTRSSQTVSDYSCNGRHVFTQTRELERPLVGSILQSMWGVSPTHLLWSSEHNTTLVDYTWSVGHTPFGPFSEVSSLSFVQKDAARRNLILTWLNVSITSMAEVLESVAGHGGDMKLLKRNQHTEFIQRWNLFNYKLDKAVTALSHMDFERAFYFTRSSDHDLYAIHSLVYEASQELEASLVCFKDPPFPWGSILMSGGVLCGVFYAYLRKDLLFRNKRKQF